MNGCCREVIEPSLKLGRIIMFLKFIAFIHFIFIVADIFIIETGFFFLLFVQLLTLLIGISSKSYSNFLIFFLICFFNIYIIFQTLGIWFQVGFYKNDNPFTFCFLVFILVFEIFCVFVIFQAYKQSKQEYRIKYGYAVGENGGNNNEIHNAQDFDENLVQQANNNNNNNNNNNQGFVPFQGRGYAVGGN